MPVARRPCMALGAKGIQHPTGSLRGMDSAEIAAEMSRAELELKSLIGEEVATLTVNSLAPEDAPFLGQIVSKLSPMIGNLLERKIIELLDANAGSGAHWERQDPGFPDAVLVGSDGVSNGAGFEVKAWYVFSTELTGRFRESRHLLAQKDIRVVVIAWAMSHVVYGAPQILDVLVVPASAVAKSRDDHYHNPPDYLIVEPGDTTARTRNLQQTNVNGYKIQTMDLADLASARKLTSEANRDPSAPHSPVEQALAQLLMSRYPYRLDTNFAKIDRVDNDEIEALKARVLASRIRDRSARAWVRLLRDLNSAQPGPRLRAEKVIQAVYDGL